MIELKCDRCGKNCELNAYVLDVRVVHNPNPVRFDDIGEIRLTDDNTHIRYMLCQSCYDKQGLPNPYRTGEKLAEEIKNSGVTQTEKHGSWLERVDGGEGFVCSYCFEGYTQYNETPYCANCGAKMDGGAE